MTRHIAPLLAALALAAAGCGDDQGSEPTGQGEQSGAAAGTEQPAETQAPATEAEQGGEGVAITIKGFAYDPAEATAKVGDTVTFTNEDGAPHDAKSTDGPDLEVPAMQQGESESTTVEEAGTIRYICTIHPQMQATLTVEE